MSLMFALPTEVGKTSRSLRQRIADITHASAAFRAARRVVEHGGHVLKQLKPAVEGAALRQLKPDVGIPVVDTIPACRACDEREDDDAKTIHQPGREQRPARAHAAQRAQLGAAIRFHRPHDAARQRIRRHSLVCPTELYYALPIRDRSIEVDL